MEQKPWWQSKTLLSVALTAVGIFAPKYAPLVNETAGDIITIIGLAGAVYGRVKATKELVAKKPAEGN
jgi:hypothetical protein